MEEDFIKKLWTNSEQVVQYQDRITQALASSLVPIERLHNVVDDSLQLGTALTDNAKDELIVQLLHWFKSEFFTWVDVPQCHVCQGTTTPMKESLETNVAERRFGASSVEGYRCQRCQLVVRFPRYNNPAKLLETRRGRCGEWANCFTLFTCALGYDSRLVVDWTDHVWTEIWSEAAGRWRHCDPCEAVFDRPLLYEDGWGKKLSYVVAFSAREISDVTWRYTRRFPEVKQRRLLCRESRICDFIWEFNKRKLAQMGEEQRERHLRRFVGELAEMMARPTLDLRSEALPGRTSGSLAWRRVRGELGTGASPAQSHVLRLQDGEWDAKQLSLDYFSARDEYRRRHLDQISKGWPSLVFSAHDVFRMEEFDWKMVYLCRKEGAEAGEISWKVDLSEQTARGVVLAKVSIQMEASAFDSGKVTATCCTENECFSIPRDGKLVLEELQPTSFLLLKARLEGGEEPNAWQKAQLFRCSFADDQPSMTLTISFQ